MHLMDAAIKAMTGRGHGGIINVASVAAFTPRGAYSAAQGVAGEHSRWANWHYAGSGVTVTAMCPGFVRPSSISAATWTSPASRDGCG